MTTDTLYYANSLTLHCDGANTSTTFTDTSNTVKTVTAVGNAQISTAQSRFGGASAIFDGVGDYLSSAAHAGFQIFGGDFCIEFSVYYASSAGNQCLFDLTSASTNRASVSLVAGALNFYTETVAGGGGTRITATAPSINNWHTIALDRSGSTITLYIDGVSAGTTTTAILPIGTTLTLNIGSNRGPSAGVQDYTGYIDEVRITKGFARHIGNYTIDAEAFSDTGVPGVLTLAATLPMLTMTAYGGAHGAMSLPMPTLAAYLGAQAAVALPMPTFSGTFGMRTDISLPMIEVAAVAHDATGENGAAITLPMITLDAECGGHIRATLPMLTAEAQMTGSALITVDISLPMLTLDAQGTGSPYIVTADIAIPMLTLEAWFGAGAAFDLPMLTATAEMTTGGVLTASINLPMLTVAAEATAQAHASLNITLPMLVPAARIAAGITLPMLALEGQITAVVAVTYEAYALNLNHKGFKDPVDELTRYTNFPFTHIVRWRNAHYGVAADGLYLLGGTTDYASPTPTAIPWAWKTGMDDFGSATKKTLPSAYFAGRFGTAATVTLYPGEDTATAYTYSVARTANAQNYRQKFGLGIKSRYFALGATGAAELDLDEIELPFAQLTRRI